MRVAKPFKIIPYNEDFVKSIIVTETCPDYSTGLAFEINYDDVDHRVIKRKIQKMVKILNKHWYD